MDSHIFNQDDDDDDDDDNDNEDDDGVIQYDLAHILHPAFSSHCKCLLSSLQPLLSASNRQW